MVTQVSTGWLIRYVLTWCLGAGAILILYNTIGCRRATETKQSNTRPKVENAKDEKHVNGWHVDIVDLIPWIPPTETNLQKSFNSDRWVLFDYEQYCIFQIQRGTSDYRSSKKVRDYLVSHHVDCFYLRADDEPMALVQKMLWRGLAGTDGSEFGFITNFQTKQTFLIEEGTESELLEIFEKIERGKDRKGTP